MLCKYDTINDVRSFSRAALLMTSPQQLWQKGLKNDSSGIEIKREARTID